ncbi:hypothetical protein, partial [Pseudogracilibacillus auburnensis]|uniref:hypothetical protein n=1 Tax=Pseudogracilibacillus auburnensis TaxID=1494959 RepID=UPI001A96013D
HSDSTQIWKVDFFFHRIVLAIQYDEKHAFWSLKQPAFGIISDSFSVASRKGSVRPCPGKGYADVVAKAGFSWPSFNFE